MAGCWSLVTRMLVIALVLAICAGQPSRAQAPDIASLKKQIDALEQAEKYGEAYTLRKQLVAKVEQDETRAGGAPGRQTGEALGTFSWIAILTRHFDEALIASKRAAALAPRQLWIETNLAHALLFTGRLGEARAIYLAHKGQPLGLEKDELWEETIAGDFDILRKAGLDQPGFKDITGALGIPEVRKTSDLKVLNDEVAKLTSARKYAEATAAAEKYVNAARQRLGETHNEFAVALSWRARLYREQGQFADAEPLYKRALAITEKALGPDHLEVSGRLNSLALMYDDAGRTADAEPLYKRSLEIAEKALGPDHTDVGVRLSILAALYSKQGRSTEAEPLYKRVLAIDEKALGPDHPDVAIDLTNLAELYFGQRRYAEATHVCWRLPKKRSAPTTLMLARRLTISPACIALRAAPPRQNS